MKYFQKNVASQKLNHKWFSFVVVVGGGGFFIVVVWVFFFFPKSFVFSHLRPFPEFEKIFLSSGQGKLLLNILDLIFGAAACPRIFPLIPIHSKEN